MKTENGKFSRFDSCAAPLCPEDITDDKWYPSEDICAAHNADFIKMQKKIQKKTQYPDYYFTHAMLESKCVIGKAIRGIDPDCRDEEKSIKQWLSKHKPKRVLTDAERKARREAIISLRKNHGLKEKQV